MNREEYLSKILQEFQNPNASKAKQTARADKYPNGYFKEKHCKHCGALFIPKAPSELYCSDHCKDYGVLNAYYVRVYGISLDTYLDMAESQNFVCKICGKPNFRMKGCHSGSLLVDHDHETGKVRGLLCHNCNRALGLFHDDPVALSSALEYLKSVTTIPKGSTPKQVEAVVEIMR